MADRNLTPAEESFMSAITHPDHPRLYTAEHLSLAVDTVMSDSMHQLTVDNPSPIAEDPSEADAVGGANEVMPWWWSAAHMGDDEFFARYPQERQLEAEARAALADQFPDIDEEEAMPWWPVHQAGDDELFFRIPVNQRANRREEVNVPDIMATFPRVADADLPDPVCPCCYVAYGTSAAEGEAAEHPVKTPCNHVFGNQCLETWLPNNSCPICRGELYQARRSRLPPISQVIDDADLPPLVIRVVDGAYSLDGEPLSMAAVRGFRDLARERAQNPQDRERQIIFAVDEEQPQSPSEQFGADDRFFLVEEVRRMVSHREYRLYQRLQREHVVLPGPRWTGPPLLNTLDWQQHRELFREIQRRGGFRYPGMRQYYYDQGEVLSDAVMFQELREAGACWHPDNSWILQDSSPLWNEDNDGMSQSGYSARGWDVDSSPEDTVQPMVRTNDEATFNELARSIDTWEI